jgi:DNA repair protein RecN (Recombination protein N)
MLVRLSIRNIVLIRSIDVEMRAGLTVLTGETGAGKSILLDALGLVLGNRAEGKLVRAGAEQASVTAVFDIINAPSVRAMLAENALVLEDETLVIRRQINPESASKAFINDQPVSLRLLKELGDRLVTLHGQHGQRGLMDVASHSVTLDAFAGNEAMRAEVSTAYQHWQQQVQRLRALEEATERGLRERDYLQHIVSELAALSPQAGEEETLVEIRTTQMQAEKSGAVLRDVSAMLGEGTTPVAAVLRQAQMALLRSPIVAHSLGQQLVEALERAQNELSDAESVLASLMREDTYDERALEKAEERLFALRDAARKHRTSVEELPIIYANAKATLAALTHNAEEHARLHGEVAMARQHYITHATALREKRNAATERLQAAVHRELAPLKMEATRFRVSITAKEERAWSAGGMDEVRFEVATNPGSPFASLNAIASGGELSRFMLALAVVLTPPNDAQLLIFDEIDTGTGGAVADAIGARLAALAAHQQVCVVTHLPQVAARGAAHLFIEKNMVEGQMETRLRPLEGEERTEELARMLSGATITEEARHAARMLQAVG